MHAWIAKAVTHHLIAETSLLGIGCDALGGLYLAYDLLGGKRGPLRIIARAVGYTVLFFFGYTVVLGLQYAAVAATGMGILLAIEFRMVGSTTAANRRHRSGVLLFGFLRGLVLGLAGMAIAGPAFGALFGLLSGAGLTAAYSIGFAPTDDYETQLKPRVSRHNLVASLSRALAVSAAGVISGLLTSSATHWVLFGLKLGLAAGIVSALVGLLSPAIEWRIDNLPERRLGVMGLGLIFVGMLLQSAQYWIELFSIPVH